MMTRARRVGWPFAAAVGVAACGGNVVVDGTAPLGGGSSSGGSVTSSGATTDVTTSGGTGGGGTGGGAIGVPDAGASSGTCDQEYYNMVMQLEAAIGCTPSDSIVQCTGKYLLHDPCGCLHVINDTSLPPGFDGTDSAWTACVEDGCCGQPGNGCPVCPTAPTVGHCDSFTSRCDNG